MGAIPIHANTLKKIKMVIPMNINEIIKKYLDGFSIDYEGMELADYKNGYAVALTDNVIIGDAETDFKLLCKMASMLNCDKNTILFGGWSDGNKTYLDLSLWVPSLEEALSLGKRFNQKAIYDFKNNKSIEVLK